MVRRHRGDEDMSVERLSRCDEARVRRSRAKRRGLDADLTRHLARREETRRVAGPDATLRISREAHLRLVSALEGEHVAEHSDDVGHGCECWTLRRRRLRLCLPARGTQPLCG